MTFCGASETSTSNGRGSEMLAETHIMGVSHVMVVPYQLPLDAELPDVTLMLPSWAQGSSSGL